MTTRRFSLNLMLPLALALGCGATENDSSDELTDQLEVSADDAGKADHAGAYRLNVSRSRTLAGGRSATLAFDVLDAAGQPVTAFDLDHTKLFHLIVVSEDLSYFSHIHPTYVGGGRFTVRWTPPVFDDKYHLYAQFHPTGGAEQTRRVNLAVPGTTIKTPVPLAADTTDSKRSGNNVLMSEQMSPLRTGAQTVGFMVHDARTGELATDLEPFLGARAHLIGVQANVGGRGFQHAHDMGGGATSGGGHSGHGGGASIDGSGALSFDVSFPAAGLYRLWVQYRRAGRDVTQFFTVAVR